MNAQASLRPRFHKTVAGVLLTFVCWPGHSRILSNRGSGYEGVFVLVVRVRLRVRADQDRAPKNRSAQNI